MMPDTMGSRGYMQAVKLKPMPKLKKASRFAPNVSRDRLNGFLRGCGTGLAAGEPSCGAVKRLLPPAGGVAVSPYTPVPLISSVLVTGG